MNAGALTEAADFVIAGGGTAGCVLASRLSEDPNTRVVLLEAGGSSDRFWIRTPAGLSRNVANPDLNWFYSTEPDPTLGNRPVIWHAGRMLGGGSAINGMVYVRGARYDYDRWAELGCTGWSWTDVLPYFLRAETFEGERSESHGTSGPLHVAPLRVVHPLARAFLQACDEVGLRQVHDYCAGDIDGAFENLVTQRRGQRSSTAASYLAAARGRPNLQVVTGALVDRVLFDDSRASGVAYRRDGVEHSVRATNEVIVSAGTIQSPAILLRSGIGPRAHLQALGIDVRMDAPQVGRNLHEHASVHNSRLVDLPTYNAIRNPVRLAIEGMNFFLFRRGMLTTAAGHGMAHGRSRPDVAHPDIKLTLLPFCNDTSTRAPHRESGITVSVNPMFPKARGEIRLRSVDAAAKPVIDYRMYEHAEDLEVMRAGLKLADRIYAAPALAKHVKGPNSPPSNNLSDEQWDEFIRRSSSIGFHAVGSCHMGASAEAVVDPQLRVRGVRKLRVIDASIMPILPSANTNAPTIMIAEKGVDLIRQTEKQGSG